MRISVVFCFSLIIVANAESTNWMHKKIDLKYGTENISFYSVVNYIGYTTRIPIVSYGPWDILHRNISVIPSPRTVNELISNAKKTFPRLNIKKTNNVLLIKEENEFSSLFSATITMNLNNQTLKEWSDEHSKKLLTRKIMTFTDYSYSKKFRYSFDFGNRPLSEILVDFVNRYGGTFYCYTQKVHNDLYAGIIYTSYPPLPQIPEEGLALPSGNTLLSVQAEFVKKSELYYCKIKLKNISSQKLSFKDLTQRNLFITFSAFGKPWYSPIILFNDDKSFKAFSLDASQSKEILLPITQTVGYFYEILFKKGSKQKKIVFPNNCVSSKDRQKFLLDLMKTRINRYEVRIKFSDSNHKLYWARSKRNKDEKGFLFDKANVTVKVNNI